MKALETRAGPVWKLHDTVILSSPWRDPRESGKSGRKRRRKSVHVCENVVELERVNESRVGRDLSISEDRFDKNDKSPLSSLHLGID